MDGDGPRYTNMYETRNKTNRRPVSCGERHLQRGRNCRNCGALWVMVRGTSLVGALVSHLVSLLALVWLCITISVISHRLLRLMANPPEVPYVIPEPPMKAVTLPKASRLSQWLNHPFLAGDEL